MPWDNSRDKRRQDAITYGAEYRHNRQIALQRAAGRCSQCSAARNLQVDHITPASAGGGHDLANLRVLCETCHDKITAQQGGGYRSPSPRDPQPRPRTRW